MHKVLTTQAVVRERKEDLLFNDGLYIYICIYIVKKVVISKENYRFLKLYIFDIYTNHLPNPLSEIMSELISVVGGGNVSYGSAIAGGFKKGWDGSTVASGFKKAWDSMKSLRILVLSMALLSGSGTGTLIFFFWAFIWRVYWCT